MKQNELFDTLPLYAQEHVISTLHVYRKCYITYEYGSYHASAHITLKSVYATDSRWVGEITSEELFTEEERTKIYLEEFHSYPSWYKGPRDYKWLHEQYGPTSH